MIERIDITKMKGKGGQTEEEANCGGSCLVAGIIATGAFVLTLFKISIKGREIQTWVVS